MIWVIVNNQGLYLVDRKKITKPNYTKWWTSDKKMALEFDTEHGADKIKGSLKYGNPTVKLK